MGRREGSPLINLQVKTALRWELPLGLAAAWLSQCLLVSWGWELWEFRLGQTGFPKGAAECLEPLPQAVDGCESPHLGCTGLCAWGI